MFRLDLVEDLRAYQLTQHLIHELAGSSADFRSLLRRMQNDICSMKASNICNKSLRVMLPQHRPQVQVLHEACHIVVGGMAQPGGVDLVLQQGDDDVILSQLPSL